MKLETLETQTPDEILNGFVFMLSTQTVKNPKSKGVHVFPLLLQSFALLAKCRDVI